MKRTKIKQISEKQIGEKITVSGWVRTVRSQKKVTFIELNDGSSLLGLQVVLLTPEKSDKVKDWTTGTALTIEGTLMKSPGEKQSLELHAESITTVGISPAEDYPIQKKEHSHEFLRTVAHLRGRTQLYGSIARIRNAISYATHRFFQQRDFIYIHTPIITASDCEGGGKQFAVTSFDLKKPDQIPRLIDKSTDFSKDFFGTPTYLTVSGQLNGEATALALSDIYTFGPTFRAEPSNTSRHLAEFWMIEPEIAFANLEDNMECAESYLKFCVDAILEECPQEIELCDNLLEKGLIKRLHQLISTPFAILTYSEGIDILQKSGKTFEHPVQWGVDLQAEHERYLTEEYCKKPLVLTHYPASIKPFYMRVNEDLRTVAAMDFLLPKVGEVIGGSQREERYDLLEEQMKKNNLEKKDYYWYLELRKYGTVPHAGFGAGLERLLQAVTGVENIRDVIPFPRYPGHAEF